MRDCPNVEMRELLPAVAADSLSGGERDRGTTHLEGCAECRDELTLLRSARAVLRRAPAMNISRVASAVATATSSPAVRASEAGVVSIASRRRPIWGWRAAASIAVLAVGVTSLGIWRVADAPEAPVAVESVAASGTTGGVAPAATVERPGLAVGGGFADLDEGELQSLLSDLGSLDASAFGEPDAMVPYVGTAEEESL